MTAFRARQELSFILENAGWPALLVEAGGTIRSANQAAVHLFGPVLESDSTSLVSLLSPDNDPAPEKVLSAWERSTPASVQLKFRTKGGLDAMFDVYICSATRDGEKRFLFQLYRAGTSATGVDLKGETVLMQKQKVDRATQLARSVALDFNNALTSIMGHSSWILSQMETAHAWRKSMEEVEKAADKAADIAQNLATFNRSEKETPSAAAGNLNTVVRRVVQQFQQAKTSKAQWNLQLEEQLFSARCDQNKVYQALVKIVENAIEAVGVAARGQIDVVTRNADVTAALQDGSVQIEPGCYVCLEVTDSGPGIAPQILPRAFEPFFTTKPGHRGLGLAWAYGAITNQGGRVTVLSEVGKGATVRVYIPAQKKVVREVSKQAKDLSGHETILLVDDEDLVLSLGKAVLSSYGYKVLAASSAETAMDFLEQAAGKVDLVIADWIMPRIGGKEMAENIRRLYPSVPVLFTSGYVNLPAAEAEDFLQKPFTTQELLQRVKQKLHSPASV